MWTFFLLLHSPLLSTGTSNNNGLKKLFLRRIKMQDVSLQIVCAHVHTMDWKSYLGLSQYYK